MALNTAVIKSRLASAPWVQKDNQAQKIIMGVTPDDLKYLDVGGVLRLYEALVSRPGVYSNRDAAAMRKLKAYTQFQPVVKTPDFGVDLVKKARPGSPDIQSQLTPELVTRIYAAEKKRLFFPERIAEWIGIDDDRIGRGQLGQDAYTDVKEYFKTALKTCLARVFISRMLQNAPSRYSMNALDFGTYKVVIPESHGTILSYPPVEDFVVAAYLAIHIENAAERAGRSTVDITRFAVAVYHGMFQMVSTAQRAVKNEINWAPVEAELLKQGRKDEVAYIHEVVQ